MKRANIRGSKLTTSLWICLCVQIVVCVGGPNDTQTVGEQKIPNPSNLPETPEIVPSIIAENTSITAKNTSTTAKTTSTIPTEPSPGSHMPTLDSGALLRGFYVFVGLSVLVVAYIIFRSFRLNESRAQMVRKYGVLAHRQDVEMRPLPLEEEDEDDTTVFDVSNVPTHGSQQRNA